MGLYPNRGLEYRVYKDSCNYIIIITLESLDNRLQTSKYYNDRYINWFNDFKQGVNCKVDESELKDIILTDKEHELISENIINAKEYGFYDVTYVASTLN